MKNSGERFERNIRLFGTEGQHKLRQASVTIVGVGGLGTHVVQQLALLGVGALALIDHEQISTTNKNRYVGVRYNDPVPGTEKVDVASRLILSIDPSIKVSKVGKSVRSRQAFDAIKSTDYVFGCVDDDGPRFVLNELATAYAKPYVDLATDVVDGAFGGRIVFKSAETGCLYCFGELDLNSVALFLEREGDRANRQAIYGIDKGVLGDAGPSVVSINGIVASLAVTEFMMACTKMAKPKQFINYEGRTARVSSRQILGRSDCPYCRQWGLGDHANTERYAA